MKLYKKVKMTREEEADIIAALRGMEEDENYNTPSKYSPNKDLYPNNKIPFSLLHIAYLRKYPDINPHQYLQNLRLITLVK